MTQNQIAYQALLETQRANLAKEAENVRSNTAKEVETNRSNLAKEAETKAHNISSEYLDFVDTIKDPIAATIYAASKLQNEIDGNTGRFFIPTSTQPIPTKVSIYESEGISGNSARGR